MRLANINGRSAAIIDTKVLDLATASNGAIPDDPRSIADLSLHDTIRALIAAADVSALPDLDEATLGAPVPVPGKAVALALNYRSHAEESNLTIPDEPHVMAKFPNCITGPFDEIVVPAGRDKIDYETEIVLVIGRQCTSLEPEQAWDVIAGVTAGQDISDRGEQFRLPIKQFSMAKSYDTFGPTGPSLCTVDEFASRDDIEITGWVNGEVVQKSRSSDFIFSVEEQLSWLSRFMTFEVGDLLFTGTTGGVGESRTPELYLRDGYVVETEIPGVGRMRNPVVER